MHVACAADTAYLPHAAAMMHSLLRRQDPASLTLHLLHSHTTDATALRTLQAFVLRLGGCLRCHAVPDEKVRGLPTMGRISGVMWLRVFLPELLPGEPRVLYLDCDTIAMDDVAPLWRTNLQGNWIAAVSNVFESGQGRRASMLGLARAADYFNSGVLLMDLDAWRRERCAEQVLQLARDRTAGLVWPDQDALNTVFAGHWLPLHPRWNCQNSLYFFPQATDIFGTPAVRAATRTPGILHFEGGSLAKPWHYLCKHPLRDFYRRHRSATPWPLTALEGRTLVNQILRPLPMGLLLPAVRFTQRAESALRRRLGAALTL